MDTWLLVSNINWEQVVNLVCIISSSFHCVLLMIQSSIGTICIRILGMCIILSGSLSLLSFMHEVVWLYDDV